MTEAGEKTSEIVERDVIDDTLLGKHFNQPNTDSSNYEDIARHFMGS